MDCDGPLPLTERNLSAMNNSDRARGWQVVSAVGPRDSSPYRREESPDERERAEIYK